MAETNNQPKIRFPEELPISDRRDELIEAIQKNQILIVAGETGSGKSTQLPKLCLAAGRGTKGRIGHTQPRRIAARTLAERVAKELDTELGKTVGYAVRFTDKVTKSTKIKLMTDGILLAEVQRDPDLKQYDTIIIDEAHERTLNIDFLLGHLQKLAQRRPDLSIIVTSATIDTQRFSEHFNDAPIIEVSGRTYPVETRYQPLFDADNTPIDQNVGICQAAKILWKETAGDILVFCSGQRDITEATEALQKQHLYNCEILPLYAKLSASEQQRVFKPQKKRRIIVATNVAETSITVPGIGSVIDTGTARISRYSKKTKVQRLPIEEVSQASANQRAGRCGRIAPGTCIRLYSEENFLERPEFTDPEIRRTNLASVILQLSAANLGEIESFPFIDKPDNKAMTDGKKLLEELGAINPKKSGTRKWITPLGRKLARLPVDVRLGRMLIAAGDNGSLQETLIIVSGLAIIDPRERPKEKQEAAAMHHSRFVNKTSDFLSYLALWEYLQKEKKALSGNQFRKMCRREYLNYMRIREWFDTHRQLKRACQQVQLKTAGGTKNTDVIHRALIAGLLSHIGVKDTKTNKKDKNNQQKRAEYIGTRQLRFMIGSQSGCKKTAPDWVVAAELIDTNAIWAQTVAKIDPEWAEHAAPHLVKKSYSEPTWDPDNGAAYIKERITLLGLTLIANRRRLLRHINPDEARGLLLYHGFVQKDWTENHHSFLEHNKNILEEVSQTFAKQRQDVSDLEESLYAFYDQRIPHDVTGVAEFNKWWKNQDKSVLCATVDDFLNVEEQQDDAELFPNSWIVNGIDLEVQYEFDPTSDIDGAAILVPIEALATLSAAPFTWTVPGFRLELITALLKSLPKKHRKALSPLAETANKAHQFVNQSSRIETWDEQTPTLLSVLQQFIAEKYSTTITKDDFTIDRTPTHLRPTFRIIDKKYTLLAEGKNLQTITQQLRTTANKAITELSHHTHGDIFTKKDMRTWDFDVLPKQVTSSTHGQQVTGYPALVDQKQSVSIQVFTNSSEQLSAHWDGIRRLLYLTIGSPIRSFDRQIQGRKAARCLNAPPVQSKAAWYLDAITSALDFCIQEHPLPWDKQSYEKIEDACTSSYQTLEKNVAKQLLRFANELVEIETELATLTNLKYRYGVADIQAHLARLFYPGFMAGIGYGKLDDLARYLSAIKKRIQFLTEKPQQDSSLATLCQQVEAEVAETRNQVGFTEEIEELTWLLEELRLTQFAPGLVSERGVSAKKIRRQCQKIRSKK